MAATLLGKKIGMTRIYTEEGENIPVTVIQAGPCFVSQIKTQDRDGYSAIQLAFDSIKARRSTCPLIGHDAAAGIAPQRFHREYRVEADELASVELGQQINVDVFEGIKYVDVVGTTKGKGFQGSMKRHGFKGQLQTHGVERKHRSPGSIGSHVSNAGRAGGVKKGKRMAGHMGDVRATVRSIDVMRIDKENGLLLVKGPVPGANNGFVVVREAVRLFKNKARKAQAS